MQRATQRTMQRITQGKQPDAADVVTSADTHPHLHAQAHPHDRSFKGIFSHRRMILELFEYLLPEETWAKSLVFESFEKCTNEYTEPEQQRSADIVWKAKLGDQAIYIYILMEFQSRDERMMALRMLNYCTLLQMDLLKQNPQKKQLTPVFPLVIYTGLKRWTSATRLSDLFPEIPEKLKAWQPNIEFRLMDEHRIVISEQQHQEDTALIELLVLAEQAKSRTDMHEIVTRLQQKLAQEHIDKKDPLVKAVSYRLHYLISQRSRHVESESTLTLSAPVTTLEEVSEMIDQTEHIDWHASAIEEGVVKGREQGLSEGLEQGKRSMLLDILRTRFAGQSALPSWVEDKVTQADNTQLAVWTQRLFSADCIESIFA